MIIFESPALALLLLLPLPVWLLWKCSGSNQKQPPKMHFPHMQRLTSAFVHVNKAPEQPDNVQKWFKGLLIALWICLVLAVMNPMLVGSARHVTRKVYDIMLAVDLSGSMLALDLAKKGETTTRLDVAKKVISNFALKRTGDRLGLILFADHAYLHVPMTFDSIALQQMLNYSVVGMAGVMTAIGDAIGLAARELRNRTLGAKILILLTDGSDTSSNIPPLAAAQIAQQFGIKIYTIGVASDKPVEILDQHGVRQKINKVVMDEKLLQEIASITGGQYFKAEDDISLEKVYEQINHLEKSEVETTEYHAQTLYRYPLGLACILFLLIIITREMHNNAK